MPEVRVTSDAPVVSVDDDPMFQEILHFAYQLSALPNTLIQLSSGYECLELLETMTNNSESYPSIILMDINMPGMSGIETVEKIREKQIYTHIPIITMLSSSDEDRDIESSLNAGANAYCEKPFDITTLKFLRA